MKNLISYAGIVKYSETSEYAIGKNPSGAHSSTLLDLAIRSVALFTWCVTHDMI